MARALQAPETDPTLTSHPRLTFQKFGYTYTVQTTGGESTYSVTDGQQTITLPIRWNFGEGAHTWVFERDGAFYESLVSYYPSIDGLDITTGDQALTPHNLEEAVGRKLGKIEPRECFGCHSSGAISNDHLSLKDLQPGVNCEHCHTGANAHMVAASQGDAYYSAPPNLKKLSAEDVSNFCGQCHRTWETVVRSRRRGEADVRFQPYRLANSKCFDGTDPRISCIACHDPHRDLVTDEATYDVKCLACHATKAPQQAHADAKACPVATSNCASCHMPKVKLPNGLMTFHDHEIRVVRPGEAYPD
ncbi:MAG TPA: multiheme c-type cytochrome [Terriglobales bacterium]|nr:multiheme c-type cytochrome [Terriglobales bacterium]